MSTIDKILESVINTRHIYEMDPDHSESGLAMLNKIVEDIIDMEESHDTDTISDGFHTFGELYYHRLVLFAYICNSNKELSWKSKLHHDGTMHPNYFIVGISTAEGMYTYHYHEKYWSMFRVKELDKAPEWDGHKPEDVDRLLSLLL